MDFAGNPTLPAETRCGQHFLVVYFLFFKYQQNWSSVKWFNALENGLDFINANSYLKFVYFQFMSVDFFHTILNRIQLIICKNGPCHLICMRSMFKINKLDFQNDNIFEYSVNTTKKKTHTHTTKTRISLGTRKIDSNLNPSKRAVKTETKRKANQRTEEEKFTFGKKNLTHSLSKWNEMNEVI